MHCHCGDRRDLIDISQNHAEFVEGMRCLATADWIKLLQCPECAQLWRTDEWDKYETLYALKINRLEGWEEADMESLIKERMVENHGWDSSTCLAKECQRLALTGKAYCADHFYGIGARA